ncbi:acetylxylan esterase [Pseudactinotalea suaedae]|uniref:acetylxylan esterase n=1 Tax=Pseudactinotalea suaedae TaxID=1524924 RepID=UPI0012E209A3|nr:acetylxylan esterase [Pseudactinotalea suaedae]
MLTDLPLAQLRSYRHPRRPPTGLREFWDDTLATSRAAGGEVIVERLDHPMRTLTVHDVTFPGFGGEPIRAWWLLPPDPAGVVIEFLGYGGGRGLPHERTLWATHGYAYLVVDSRGQGSIWNTGDTPDPHGSGPAAPGMLTRGVEAPEHLYYRRLLTDAVRAVDAVPQLPAGAGQPIAVVGHSQGGAMSLAAAALHDDVAAAFARTPYLCGIARSVEVAGEGPYRELGTYLATYRDRGERTLAALDHVDVAHLSSWIGCPTMISVGLGDLICPPSGIFAAINAMSPPPETCVWPHNGHEGGGAHDDACLAGWLDHHLRGVS